MCISTKQIKRFFFYANNTRLFHCKQKLRTVTYLHIHLSDSSSDHLHMSHTCVQWLLADRCTSRNYHHTDLSLMLPHSYMMYIRCMCQSHTCQARNRQNNFIYLYLNWSYFIAEDFSVLQNILSQVRFVFLGDNSTWHC